MGTFVHAADPRLTSLDEVDTTVRSGGDARFEGVGDAPVTREILALGSGSGETRLALGATAVRGRGSDLGAAARIVK